MKVLICHAEAGHGHRKVAEAIEEAIKKKDASVSVEVLDALTKTPKSFAWSYPLIYFWSVMHIPWLWGAFFFLTNASFIYFFVRPFRSFWNHMQSARLRAYVIQGKYDVILFTHFFSAEVCATLKRRGKLTSKLITVVTDVIPHQVWQNNGTDIYWVMAENSKSALMSRGIDEKRIYAKGIPVNDIFLKQLPPDELKASLGLSSERLTVLFTSGSFGLGPIQELLLLLNQWKTAVQAIVICGNNENLLKTLRAQESHYEYPVQLHGFIHNMHEMMDASDIMFAKPGGATMCESLVKDLPMIIVSIIPGQETFNAEWLLESEAAFKMNTVDDVDQIMKRVMGDKRSLENMRMALRKIAKPNAARDIASFVLNHEKGHS